MKMTREQHEQAMKVLGDPRIGVTMRPLGVPVPLPAKPEDVREELADIIRVGRMHLTSYELADAILAKFPVREIDPAAEKAARELRQEVHLSPSTVGNTIAKLDRALSLLLRDEE